VLWLSEITSHGERLSLRFCGETLSRVSTHLRDQSLAWHRIVPHNVLVNFRAGQHRQRQVHIHTRFSHTLHITQLHITHATTFRIVPHIRLLISVLGNTGSVKFTSHTLSIHTRLAKGNTGSVKFTLTHASHSHTLHIHTSTHHTASHHTRFTSHTHTRDNLFCGETPLARQHAFPRPIACVASAERPESENTHRADTHW
jgi:hypothetical protein